MFCPFKAKIINLLHERTCIQQSTGKQLRQIFYLLLLFQPSTKQLHSFSWAAIFDWLKFCMYNVEISVALAFQLTVVRSSDFQPIT